MINQKLKPGAWCFTNYKLVQILQMDGSKIHTVSDGIEFSLYSIKDLAPECFPINSKIIAISKEFEIADNSFSVLKIPFKIHMQIKNELHVRWVNTCKAAADEKRFNMFKKELGQFCEEKRKFIDETFVSNQNKSNELTDQKLTKKFFSPGAKKIADPKNSKK